MAHYFSDSLLWIVTHFQTSLLTNDSSMLKKAGSHINNSSSAHAERMLWLTQWTFLMLAQIHGDLDQSYHNPLRRLQWFNIPMVAWFTSSGPPFTTSLMLDQLPNGNSCRRNWPKQGDCFLPSLSQMTRLFATNLLENPQHYLNLPEEANINYNLI